MSSPTNANSNPTPTTSTAERRRSSGSGGLFGNLMQHKRGADNAAYNQRRTSLEEMGAKKGAFGQMWDNLVKSAGPSSSPPK